MFVITTHPTKKKKKKFFPALRILPKVDGETAENSLSQPAIYMPPKVKKNI